MKLIRFEICSKSETIYRLPMSDNICNQTSIILRNQIWKNVTSKIEILLRINVDVSPINHKYK